MLNMTILEDVARAMDTAFKYRNYFRKVKSLDHARSVKELSIRAGYYCGSFGL